MLIEEMWSRLRADGGLISQRKMRGEHGKCAAVSIVNAAQATLMINGSAPLASAQATCENLLDTLKTGPVWHRAVATAVRDLLAAHFAANVTRIDTVLVPQNSESLDANAVIRAPRTRDLIPRRRQIKLVSGVEWTGEGKMQCYHIKLIKAVNGSRLIVVDPNIPDHDVELTRVGRRRWNGDRLPLYEYTGAVQMVRWTHFTPFAVITIEVTSPRPESRPPPGGAETS